MRLEDRVGEAESQDVLHRLLAQIMIDAVDLRLAVDPGQAFGQGAGRGLVMPERLLDYDPRVLAVLSQTGLAEPLDDRREHDRRNGQVVDVLGLDLPFLFTRR